MKTLKVEQKARLAVLNRLMLLLLFAAVWFIAILFRLVDLQGFRSEYYRELASEQQWGYVEISPKRGEIYDRNLEGLALNVRADFIYAHPHEIENPRHAAGLLAQILETDSSELLEKLDSDRSFVYLKRKVPPHLAKKVRALGIQGIGTREESKRIYPNRELACHVLGFVGLDGEGLGGLEYSYNKELGGRKQRIDLRFDARRTSYQRVSQPGQTTGNTLILTLDSTIQHVAEKVLRKTVQEHGALNGVAIVMDPHNGDILAMASYPFFNPNNYTEYSVSSRRNRAILDLYEPGSTFKAITLAAVLNEGLTNLDEVINCRVGTARLAGKVYREAKTNFEDLTVTQIFAKSSNVGTVKLGLRLGNERLYNYIRQFGFGKETGIELPGEECGLLRPTHQWSRISIGAISIGQEIGVTPIQMISAMATVPNGGYLVSPNIVKQINSPEGDLLYKPEKRKNAVLRPTTVSQLKRAMITVVSSGTGRISKLNGYSSAGKTGTAQKIVNGVYSKKKYVASFVGFAPVQDPALITLVVINEPMKGLPWGGYVAGPAFKEIMERALIQLRVPQDRPPSPRLPNSEMARTNSPVEEQKPERDISGIEKRILLSDLEATMSNLRRGEAGSDQESTVTLFLEDRILPDFRGKNLREVAKECADMGLRLKISGTGLAVGQRPVPGERFSEGTLCEVFFSKEGLKLNAASGFALSNSDKSSDEDYRRQN
jgi:cell division protein FtsI/penicillin-binding protein 2